MAAAETSISNPPPKHTSVGGFDIEHIMHLLVANRKAANTSIKE